MDKFISLPCQSKLNISNIGFYWPSAKTLQLLEANPFHLSLRLHALSGKLQDIHSVSINLSYRITLEFLIQEGQIIPINVSDQDIVY